MEHTITLVPSGHAFRVAGEKNILQGGLDAGLFLPYSCRAGACQTCRAKVTSGDFEHDEAYTWTLTPEDRAEGVVLLCQAKAKSDLVVEVQELNADEALRPVAMPVRVLEMERLAPDVMRLILGTPMNDPLVFRAGQYLELRGPGGLRRTYSMANAPSVDGVRRLEIHVRHLPGGQFTDYLFGAAKPKEVWRIEAPLGSFYLHEDSDKPVVLIAAGTGFAPIKSMVEHCIAKGIDRPMTLYWGGRTRADIYQAALAEGWTRRLKHFRFVPVLSAPTAGCDWRGRTGYAHRAAMADFPDMSGLRVYACGTPAAVESARTDFTHRGGLPASEFFADSFVTNRELAGAKPAAVAWPVEGLAGAELAGAELVGAEPAGAELVGAEPAGAEPAVNHR